MWTLAIVPMKLRDSGGKPLLEIEVTGRPGAAAACKIVGLTRGDVVAYRSDHVPDAICVDPT